MLGDYATIGIFLLLTILFPLAALGLAWVVRPKPLPDEEKLTTYECGVDTQGRTWVRFRVNYFLYALVFLAFDIETIFLFPWAVRFKALGLFAFVEMLVFIAILLTGLWYAWKEGALEWY
ncbi:NAD(P)H-quinone oxidoreductase subunit 3, bacterial/plastid [Syntrophomonas zehnderi OL-4]|uniref:NADH-quinone oxidoreductase subunit A n=1 Tax=Syntrophomonas zehnderi OL-4 TaxID=690567 RepID=A0A0E4GAC5_9FIRM|nr:NADH-quinone oxidoreductase subunit A [Syntrophomonas zehnderi]CFX28692.1 NAD(P)H-quinone oxidoreductase subunit 3, bacterial/plastid [Syntrophomonas zehnderi OL-4]